MSGLALWHPPALWYPPARDHGEPHMTRTATVAADNAALATRLATVAAEMAAKRAQAAAASASDPFPHVALPSVTPLSPKM